MTELKKARPPSSELSHAALRRRASTLDQLYRRGKLTSLLNDIVDVSADLQIQRLDYRTAAEEVVFALRRNPDIVIFAIRLDSAGSYSINGAPLRGGWHMQLQALALPRSGARDSIVVKPPGSRSRGAYVRLSRKLFRALADEIHGSTYLAGVETFHLLGPLPADIAECVVQILDSNLKGKALAMFVRAKGMELAVRCVSAMAGLGERIAEPIDLKPVDRERLLRVRELLDREPGRHVTLPQLARGAGVNVNKLKSGFRQLFGKTVFEYLRVVRLAAGARRLSEGRDTISTIAQDVGFKSATHFAIAFRRRYGCAPHNYRRQQITRKMQITPVDRR